ncbi:MAG: hypothetical protein WD040_04230 [Anaerolineales bacterium]
MEAESPLQLVLADTAAITSRDTLLGHITDLIRESGGCIFDATGGNPNVSLEVGVAHALGADFMLTMNTRNASAASRGKRAAGGGKREVDRAKPIIADLQGRNRIEYRSYAGLRKQLIDRFLRRLPYWKRWEDFRHQHPAWAPAALIVFTEIRRHGRATRPRLEAALREGGVALPALLSALRKGGLLAQRRGRLAGYVYPVK